jgi:hypothetical protein
MSGTSEDKVISGLSFTKANDIYNTLVNIGIKYNRINTYDNPILTITTKENGKTVVVYANKIVFFDSEKQVSIRKASTYNLSEDENFQLITLCSNNVDSATEASYQRTIYIDGRLESAINTFTEVPINIDSITLHSGNYQINLIDVAYISPQTPSTIDLVASNYDLAYHMKKLH